MQTELSVFLSNPLNQLLISVPLSIVGNLSTDRIKIIFEKFQKQNRIAQLEDTLFYSFLKALDIHQNQYDIATKSRTIKLKNIVKTKRNEFFEVLRTANTETIYSVPANLDMEQVQKVFIDSFINVFNVDLPGANTELLTLILRDTCTIYRDAFFNHISQDEQIWIIFKESFKIDSLVDIVKEIHQNIPSREEFESIRAYVVRNEITTDKIITLKHNYLSYVRRKFSSIELTGVSPRVHGQDISFELKDIFIPFKFKENKRYFSVIENRHSKLFEDSDPLRHDKLELLNYLEKYSQIVLLGDPGGGKTTLLKYITYQICEFQDRSKYLPFYIPIFLRISEYARALKLNPSKRLLDFLLNDYDKQYSDLFRWSFEKRQVLLLLDGLDEVLDTSQRIMIVDEVHDLVARMPENRYIVTSRIIGYDSAPLKNTFQHFTIQKFNREQIHAFCQSWYKAVIKNSLRDNDYAETEAEKLYNAIINKQEIENLACNPLLITLIANIHFKGQTLPYNRVQLYDIATETLLQYWVQHRTSDESQLKDKDDVIEILSPVAFYIHENNPEGLIEEKDFYEQCKLILEGEEYALTPKEIRHEIKELIKFLREQSGFFHEKGVDENSGNRFFGFLHQTFQEYLTAIEIVNRWKEQKLDVALFVQNPRWTESLRLASGILSAEKGRARKRSSTQFAEDILESGLKGNYIRAVLLVALILIDNIDLNPQFQESFFDLFFSQWEEQTERKILEEIEKSANYLLQSKHKSAIIERLKPILDQETHPLDINIIRFISQNYYSIDGAKEKFIKFLHSKNDDICIAAWSQLKEFSYNEELGVYYAAQQYGHIAYAPYNIAAGLDNFIPFYPFFDLVESLSQERFVLLIPTLISIANSYFNVYASPDGHSSYSIRDVVSDLIRMSTTKARTICLLLLQDRGDLLDYKNEILSVLQSTLPQNDIFIDAKRKIMAKITDLESKVLVTSNS